MDVLKEKFTKNYDSLSRYSPLYYSYNTLDNKYIYEIGYQLDDSTEYVAHKIEFTDTLDNLSLKYYGRPDYYWIIADFNRIKDPYINLYKKFKVIKIPSLSSIRYIEVN